ncbi:MAG TPA: hypothetical protein DC053_11085 [Lachnoclostridium sp.]|nr:hypothetical protein [Lachnoclostridium sp.]
MKKNFKINLIGLLAIIMLLSFLPTKIYASEYQIGQMQTNESFNISSRAEEKGYKYKIMNGRQYKRLWSYTYARWVDKEWTLV